MSLSELLAQYAKKKEVTSSSPTVLATQSGSAAHAEENAPSKLLSEKILKINSKSCIESGQHSCDSVDPQSQMQSSVAILFLIIDEFPNEVLWRVWINQTAGISRTKIYFHAKYPDRVQSSWVRDHLVGFRFSF
jgi:hypothetical protein